MSNTINFGIDLGTTNSLIARSTLQGIEVFRNPAGMKETLPSVVAFRKERILIGDKAREYVEKDAANVFSGFKRKMGTDESFFVPNTSNFITPIELSTMVLRELKNFIYTNEDPASIIITIPASFDTIQSNATREAGLKAGFSEVLLLQEPIAASLAFANKADEGTITGNWLVYDLGGGTFDVALVKIEEEEMRVVDHEGDNFLGGLDFDQLIVSRLIIPYLENKYGMQDLEKEMLDSRGKYNTLYYKLLYKAEEAKIMLSSQASADIEFDFDVNDDEEEVLFTITREDFESLIWDKLEYSIDFISNLLSRNQLLPSDIRETILVGGSTYIPLVRRRIPEKLNIAVNCQVDPTTAVAIGAAYYAGSKTSNHTTTPTVPPVAEQKTNAPAITVRMVYQKHSREKEEYFTAAVGSVPAGYTYRITREDGGYDSGIKPLQERISEMLALLPNTLNSFRLKIYDAQQDIVPVDIPEISIVQGKFSIYGQPLPNDICLEVDDVSNNLTQLELIFSRNDLLPLKKMVTKTLSRSILKGSGEQLLINVLEGSRYASPQSNLPIGIISISGKQLQKDLVKGCDIELTFEISESRDISISAYIPVIDEDYKEVFSPTTRAVNIDRLKEETDYLLRTANRNLQSMVSAEQYEGSAVMQSVVDELEQVRKKLNRLSSHDVTDTRYQLEEQKRKLAQRIDNAGKEQFNLELKEEYYEEKLHCQHYLQKAQDPQLLKKFAAITGNEQEWMELNSAAYIKRKIRELRSLSWDIRRKDPEYVTGLYLHYALRPDSDYTDPRKLKELKKRGDEALTRQNADEIMAVVYQMYELLIDKDDDEMMKGTGLR